MSRIDKTIREKLENRILSPSPSAWERMSVQLDNADKKKRRKVLMFLGYAASILFIISTLLLITSETNESEFVPKDQFVNQPVDSNFTNSKSLDLNASRPKVQLAHQATKIEVQRIKGKIPSQAIENVAPEIFISESQSILGNTGTMIATKNADSLTNQVDEEIKKAIRPNEVFKKSIIVDSDALLFAVTQEKESIKKYYAEYRISRDAVLDSVRIELKKFNINVSAEAMLAKIENDLVEENFQNNFLKKIKSSISYLASAIATRNQ